MSTIGAKQEPTLVAWHSLRGSFEVLGNTLKALRNRRVRVRRVVYLVQSESVLSEVPASVGDSTVETLLLPLDDPTEHLKIYEQVRRAVLPKLKGLSNVHINVSPGTPAMHVVWLVLHAGGALPDGTKLWSSQYDPTTKRTRIDPVNFPVSTYLGEIRKEALLRPDVEVYDPQAHSKARRSALERLARYARVPGAPLLVLGERGTGKTRLVETYVAALKQRPNVVAVPCGGIETALAESVLFGHVRGAFTGAVEDREGLLGLADGGVLFLDEVQDLPKQLQRKLVRVFQDRRRRYRSVGGDREREADVELVCASNLPLDELRSTLDPDLFDRLSQLIATVPPLRECGEDLEDDWRRVWQELRRSEALPEEAPTPSVILKELRQSRLPGNLRDLQRLAALVMAWLPQAAPQAAAEAAVSEWLSTLPLVTRPSGGAELESGTWDGLTRGYQAELARRAKQKHGTWARAAAALSCDESTLRRATQVGRT